MTNCKQCGANVPQTSKRERLFCNDKCRMAFKRSNNEQNTTPIANKSITNSPKINNEQPITNKCKSCGADVLPLIDVCHACVDKGVTRESLNLPDIPQETIGGKNREWQPNWKRKGMKNQKEALERMIAAVSEVSGDSGLFMGNRIFDNKKVLRTASQLK